MEKIINKYRGKINLKDEIKKFRLERTMCDFSISVRITTTFTLDDAIDKILNPIQKQLMGKNKDYVCNRIIVYHNKSRVDPSKEDMGIIFWYPYNLNDVPDDLIFDPGRYSITLKTIDNK